MLSAIVCKLIEPVILVALTFPLACISILPSIGPATFVSILISPCIVLGITGGIISQNNPGDGGTLTPGVFGTIFCCNAL